MNNIFNFRAKVITNICLKGVNCFFLLTTKLIVSQTTPAYIEHQLDEGGTFTKVVPTS